jgi:transposase InsO family protein
MDGRGRWLDNVFTERLWRSLKYEEVYLKSYADGREARAGIATWIAFYNGTRPPQALDEPRPDDLVAGGDDGPPARERRGHDAPASGLELGRRQCVAHMPTAATTADH